MILQRIEAHRRVLAIGAHPDDVILGAGGYLLKLREAGHEITMLTLSTGELTGSVGDRAEEEMAAAAFCDFTSRLAELPDGSLDLGAVIRCIEEAVDTIAPHLVLTHHDGDTHQDHRTVAHATAAACRIVPSIYTYEGPSSVAFQPTMTVDCTATWQRKITALGFYVSQMERRPYVDWAQATSVYRSWPRYTGARCEAFTALHQDPQTFPTTAANSWTDGLVDAAATMDERLHV